VRIDADSNTVVSKIQLVGQLSGMAVAGSSLWAVNHNHAALESIDPQRNALAGNRVEVGNDPVILGNGVDETGAIWVSNVSEGTVTKVKF